MGAGAKGGMETEGCEGYAVMVYPLHKRDASLGRQRESGVMKGDPS